MLKNKPDLAKNLTVKKRTHPLVVTYPYAIYRQKQRNLDNHAIYGGENTRSPIIRVIHEAINFEQICYLAAQIEFALTLRILNNWDF